MISLPYSTGELRTEQRGEKKKYPRGRAEKKKITTLKRKRRLGENPENRERER